MLLEYPVCEAANCSHSQMTAGAESPFYLHNLTQFAVSFVATLTS